MEEGKEAKEIRYNVSVSHEAHKIISDEDEIRFYVKYALHAFSEEPEANAFTLGKLNLVLVKDGTDLTLITKEEKDKLLEIANKEKILEKKQYGEV